MAIFVCNTTHFVPTKFQMGSLKIVWTYLEIQKVKFSIQRNKFENNFIKSFSKLFLKSFIIQSKSTVFNKSHQTVGDAKVNVSKAYSNNPQTSGLHVTAI